MPRDDMPDELKIPENHQVLAAIESLSAHSDVAEVLRGVIMPLGDAQCFCPDPLHYRYVVAYTQGVIFAFAVGMNTLAFRLDGRMKMRALTSGAAPCPDAGNGWVSFTLFRDDWPDSDLKFWARKAYVTAGEGR